MRQKVSERSILIVTTEFPPGPGGIGQAAYHLGCHLSSAGWQVKVVATQDYANGEEIESFNSSLSFRVISVPRFTIKGIRWLVSYAIVIATILRMRPRFIHTCGERSTWLVAFVPLLFGVHRSAEWYGNSPLRWLEARVTRFSYGTMNLVVAVSDYCARHMLAQEVHPDRFEVIHCGADTNEYFIVDEKTKHDFRLKKGSEKAFILLTVGNVSERKGHDVVIRALPKIIGKIGNVLYWIAGLPTRQKELEQLATENGVSEHLQFFGVVSTDMLRMLYNACDLFVLTSKHSANGESEGFGIVAVEAALCGKPAIVSDSSGLVEAIVPGETGLVVRENDPDDAAGAIIELFSDRELLSEMGNRARQRALMNQSWNASMNKYEQAFLSTLRREIISQSEPGVAAQNLGKCGS